jgi:DNA-directed RNA polymerase subunit RPC12/RpoP
MSTAKRVDEVWCGNCGRPVLIKVSEAKGTISGFKEIEEIESVPCPHCGTVTKITVNLYYYPPNPNKILTKPVRRRKAKK